MTAPLPPVALERDMCNALRALAMDAVQKANSGHPGMPMGMAEIAYALWTRHLRHNPSNPKWPDRDRFVLSNGHGSMLQYALLHLTGYELPIEELANFRQLHSLTPGHPELGVTPGVETTTGPLGQGLANAVGLALAEKILAAEFNRQMQAGLAQSEPRGVRLHLAAQRFQLGAAVQHFAPGGIEHRQLSGRAALRRHNP